MHAVAIALVCVRALSPAACWTLLPVVGALAMAQCSLCPSGLPNQAEIRFNAHLKNFHYTVFSFLLSSLLTVLYIWPWALSILRSIM